MAIYICVISYYVFWTRVIKNNRLSAYANFPPHSKVVNNNIIKDCLRHVLMSLASVHQYVKVGNWKPLTRVPEKLGLASDVIGKYRKIETFAVYNWASSFRNQVIIHSDVIEFTLHSDQYCSDMPGAQGWAKLLAHGRQSPNQRLCRRQVEQHCLHMTHSHQIKEITEDRLDEIVRTWCRYQIKEDAEDKLSTIVVTWQTVAKSKRSLKTGWAIVSTHYRRPTTTLKRGTTVARKQKVLFQKDGRAKCSTK